VRRAISSGSSPASAGSLRASTQRGVPGSSRPLPRVATPGVRPAARRRSTSATTSGVLPLPPATTLPTTTTGTPARCCFSQPRR
jgi:hypothetical protein